MSNNKTKFNGSGCKDETAHIAIENVSREEADALRRVGKVISIIKLVLELAGLKQINRIELLDKKTGNEYK